MAAALATAQVVAEKKLGGKVVLFGTPAEGKYSTRVASWMEYLKLILLSRGWRRQNPPLGCRRIS
jgi:hypothetical protein